MSFRNELLPHYEAHCSYSVVQEGGLNGLRAGCEERALRLGLLGELEVGRAVGRGCAGL